MMTGFYVGDPFVTSKKVTKLAYLSRFTDDEAINIDLASIGETRDAALVRRYLQKVNAASYIDLAAPVVSEDLQKLVDMGLITNLRKQQILESPVLESEKQR